MTPLHWAAEDGHADVVRLLLADPRVDVNVKGLGVRGGGLLCNARTSYIGSDG